MKTKELDIANPQDESKNSQVEIERLQGEIDFYSMSIEEDENNADAHHMKAKTLADLGRISKNSACFAQSLQCYNRAIELNSAKAVYYADRATLHVYMENPEPAVDDMRAVNSLPQSGSKITQTYLKNTMRDIATLDQVQSSIKKLQNNGTISEELAKLLTNHAGVTANLVVQVGAHGQILTQHDDEIEKLKAMVKELSEGKRLTEAQITTLEQKTEDMKKEVIQNKAQIQQTQEKALKIEEKIEKIESKIATLIITSSTEFKDLSQKLSNLTLKETLFEGRLKLAEGRLDDHEERLVLIDDTLKQANIYKELEIKEKFERLKTATPNEVLYKYANSFHWALSNYLLAYRAIGTGLVEGARDKSKFEEVWSKVGGTVMTALGIVPVVGGILPLVERGISMINDTYQDAKFDRKVEKINSIITSNSILEKDLSLAVASSAIQIATIRQNEIIKNEKAKHNPQNQGSQGSQASKSDNPMDKAMTKFNEEIDKLLTKATKITKMELTPAQAMAVKDVILFINYIATHDDTITVTNHGQGLDRTITEILCNHALPEALQTQSQNHGSSQSGSKKSDDCIICKVDQITYDNPLLNHPELLKFAIQNLGGRALDLSTKLSPELIEAAAYDQAQTKDGHELLLAGLMSLEHAHDE